MTKLEKLNVFEAVRELERPFSVMAIATVGDMLFSIYICQGTLEWHSHLDNDELFWVCEGTISLESEWGDVQLRPGELAVVPKGVRHRSSSGVRTSVLLVRCGFFSNRKNGRRRLYAISGESKLKRASLHGVLRTLTLPFQFQTVAQVEDSILQLAWGEGTWPVEIPAAHDVLFFVLNGAATARTPQGMVHLHPGDLTVVPRGAIYQISTVQGTALVRMTRKDV